jgi:hypothetical protein
MWPELQPVPPMTDAPPDFPRARTDPVLQMRRSLVESVVCRPSSESCRVGRVFETHQFDLVGLEDERAPPYTGLTADD